MKKGVLYISIAACLVVVILFLMPVISDKKQWNEEFVTNKITKQSILREVPIGSDIGKLKAYIKQNRIPEYTDNNSWGYTEKRFKSDYPYDFGSDQAKTKIKFVVELHGHQVFQAPPRYYHPLLYFGYSKEGKLVFVGFAGYP